MRSWNAHRDQQSGYTIVMVTHEHELVAQFDHRIIQIEKGRLVADTAK